MRFAAALAALALLAACGPRPPATADNAETPPPSDASASAVADWAGQWNGPEGTYLRIEPTADASAAVTLTIANLDGPKTFAGVVAGDTIQFTRDGVTETIKAGDGEATGMKWLAEKKDCLVVKTGEGYCRD